MPTRVRSPLRAMYGSLRRRFRLGASVGDEWQATNGILQGCPLSVFLLNALMAVWSRAVEAEVAGAQAVSYADDPYILGHSAATVQQGLDITVEFEALTEQRIHLGKASCFCSCPAAAQPLLVHGQPLSPAQRLVSVGANLAVAPGAAAPIDPARPAKAAARAVRVRTLPVPWEAQQSLLSTLVLPAALYGCDVSRVVAGALKSLRTKIVGAMWRGRIQRRSPAIVLTVLAPGHRLDPEQYVAYARLCLLRRMWHNRPQLRAIIAAVWTARVAGSGGAPGPIRLALDSAQSHGWVPGAVGEWSTVSGEPRCLCSIADSAAWQHEVREGIRRAVWRRTAHNRSDMGGLDTGVDRRSTRALLDGSPALCGPDKTHLRGILSGSVWTAEARGPGGTPPRCLHSARTAGGRPRRLTTSGGFALRGRCRDTRIRQPCTVQSGLPVCAGVDWHRLVWPRRRRFAPPGS